MSRFRGKKRTSRGRHRMNSAVQGQSCLTRPWSIFRTGIKLIVLKYAKDDGVVGVVHKATRSNNYFDPTYNQRKKDAAASGLLWGAYKFLQRSNMKEQAQHFVSEVGKDLDLYAADYEDEGVSLDELKTFLREVKRLTGKSRIMYSSHILKEELERQAQFELSQYEPGWRNTHQVRQAGQKQHFRNGGSGNTQSMVNAMAFPAIQKAISMLFNKYTDQTTANG